MGCSLPGSSVHGILQARILGWVAISSSRETFLGSNLGLPSLLHWQANFTEAPGKPYWALGRSIWRELVAGPVWIASSQQIFIGRTDAEAEAEAPILWPPNAKSWLMGKTLMLGRIEGRRKVWQRMMVDGIIDWMNMSLRKLWELVKDKEARCAALHGVEKSQTSFSN